MDEKVCNDLQKWTKDKCRCECLQNKDFENGYSWNVNNCRSERFPDTEKCNFQTSEKIKDTKKKTVILIKRIKNCKPFIGIGILFLCVSAILIGIMIYFYLKS